MPAAPATPLLLKAAPGVIHTCPIVSLPQKAPNPPPRRCTCTRGGLSNAPRLWMPHLSDIRPFLRRKRSFPGPGVGLACLNYSRHDTHTKVHIARSTATNRGEGALHLGAEVSMHCAISMWIPPLHRTMAPMRRARKRPRRRPPGAPCNPRGGAGWVRVRFYDKAGASKRPKRAQHQKLLCMFKMSIRRPQNRT